jgi:UDP-N-acetylglucosamine transferase subunit ALG13
MIFITVGTHEQQFNRLIEKIDQLKKEKIINQKIFAQVGYSDYIPEEVETKKMLSHHEMDKYVSDSEICITHGGPGSIMQVMSKGKVPIVVPRQKKFDEHVDNHQVFFAEKLEKEKMCLVVYNIEELQYVIENYKELSREFIIKDNSNKNKFINKLNNYTSQIINI